MRIIAGEYKGRSLRAPADDRVRPTTEKVREALFSILAPDLWDAVCCDLFAGTGSLGLEALSRGAARCYFGDHAGSSIALIKANVAACRAEERSRIIHGDHRKVLAVMEEPADLIFLDPPFGKGLIQDAMEAIGREGKLAPGGKIVCEHYREEALPDALAGFQKTKERRYGKVVLSIFS